VLNTVRTELTASIAKRILCEIEMEEERRSLRAFKLHILVTGLQFGAFFGTLERASFKFSISEKSHNSIHIARTLQNFVFISTSQTPKRTYALELPMIRRVLLVDDDSLLREVIMTDLRRRGLEVHEADSGNKAVAILQTTVVDVILSDIQMPQGTGIDLLDTVRAHHPNLPVVVLMTGHTHFSEGEVLKRGAFKVLAKPFARSALLQALEDAFAEAGV